MMAVVIVDHRRPSDTLRSLRSVLFDGAQLVHVWLVLNAPEDSPAHNRLMAAVRFDNRVTVIENVDNRGFAGGCNTALAPILLQESFAWVLLLNNDAWVESGFLAAVRECTDSQQPPDMVAVRMLRAGTECVVDSLGITLYRSGIAANRRWRDEPLLGPCGGAAIYSTALLRELRHRLGEIFDERLFCYAEDTDLAMRARALGKSCGYVDAAVVWHEGSATSGGSESDFVAYHGLRNSLVTIHKNYPARLLVSSSPWLLLGQVLVAVKYCASGRGRLWLRVWRDFWRLHASSKERRQRLFREVDTRNTALRLRAATSSRFYQSGYFLQELQRWRLRKTPQ